MKDWKRGWKIRGTFRDDRRLLESPRVTIILESMTKKFNRFRGSRPFQSFRGVVLLIIKFSSFRRFVGWKLLAIRLLSLLRCAIADTNFRETREREREKEGGRERRWILDLVKLHEENCKARSAATFHPRVTPESCSVFILSSAIYDGFAVMRCHLNASCLSGTPVNGRVLSTVPVFILYPPNIPSLHAPFLVQSTFPSLCSQTIFHR